MNTDDTEKEKIHPQISDYTDFQSVDGSSAAWKGNSTAGKQEQKSLLRAFPFVFPLAFALNADGQRGGAGICNLGRGWPGIVSGILRGGGARG
jgi:hypothetical protein